MINLLFSIFLSLVCNAELFMLCQRYCDVYFCKLHVFIMEKYVISIKMKRMKRVGLIFICQKVGKLSNYYNCY